MRRSEYGCQESVKNSAARLLAYPVQQRQKVLISATMVLLTEGAS